jgi:hypothetical protein
MYFGEIERMGHSLASILGMRPSTYDPLSNSTTSNNLTEKLPLGPMDGKEDHFLAYNVVMACYLYVYWRDGKHGA